MRITRMQKYSVLMTMYKKDNVEYARRAIDSMLNQTIKTDDFVIICDGALTKELYGLLNEYKKNYKCFKIVQLEKNVGLGAALRYGVEICQHNLIARMDDDDIAKCKRCELELAEFDKDKSLSICGSYMNEFEDDCTKPIREKKVPTKYDEILKYSKRRNPFNHSTIMMKKDEVIKCGNYSAMRTNQDVELWIRMLNSGMKGINIPISLVDFRFNNNTYRRRKDWRNVSLMLDVWKEFYKKDYCSMGDFLYVLCLQLIIFIMPQKLLKWSYDHFR